MITIREEQPEDIQAIREVNTRAFGQPQEADIADQLRKNCKQLLSLVAVRGNRVIGHILFSPVVLESKGKTITGMGLGPMAVLPEYQSRGIGKRLIEAGLERLSERGYPFVVVLGHPEYYPRFGFEPAIRHGIRCEWEVPDAAFMISIMNKLSIQGISAVARYRPEFAETV